MKKTYKELKEEAREKAIDWQNEIITEDEVPSLDEFCEQQYKFEKLAKRYGLVKEFKENAII